MASFTSDIAFTPAVKALQERNGSRHAYARMEQNSGWSSEITDELAAFISERDSFYIATANAQGQPYIQHRGGPAGFLRVLDAKSLAFADFRGNRQYITAGNLKENERAFLFLMDYENRQRIKVWGRARVIDDDAALIARVAPVDYRARPERVVVFDVDAWDANCPQHIPQLVAASKFARQVQDRDDRIAALEAELAQLRKGRAEQPCVETPAGFPDSSDQPKSG